MIFVGIQLGTRIHWPYLSLSELIDEGCSTLFASFQCWSSMIYLFHLQQFGSPISFPSLKLHSHCIQFRVCISFQGRHHIRSSHVFSSVVLSSFKSAWRTDATRLVQNIVKINRKITQPVSVSRQIIFESTEQIVATWLATRLYSAHALCRLSTEGQINFKWNMNIRVNMISRILFLSPNYNSETGKPEGKGDY